MAPRQDDEGASAARSGRAAAVEVVRQSVGHDLRAPLAVILGRCELLADPVTGGDLTPAQLRSVATVRRQAERLAAMLDALAPYLDALD